MALTIREGSFGGTLDVIDDNGNKVGTIIDGSFGGTYDFVDNNTMSST